MKYVFPLVVLIICAVAYIRSQQPKIWNDCLAAMQSPQPTPSTTTDVPPPAVVVDAAPITAPPVVAPPKTVVVISPDSTNFINPDHVRQVEQPAQPNSGSPSGIVINTNVVTASPKVFIPPDPIPAQANWTWTVLGRDYNNVKVTKVEADSVSIMYDGGMGRVNQSDLTPDLQKMFNYDPQAAELARHQKAAALAQAEAAEAQRYGLYNNSKRIK